MPPPSTFGRWVRQRRKSLGLTQEELARRVSCALVTIQKIETEVRRPSLQVARSLATELQLPAEEEALFLTMARSRSLPQQAPGDSPAADRRAARLPAPSSPLIGREQETAALQARLLTPGTRMVTLLGPPGVGKTRLATHVAGQASGCFADGVAFVSLAPISDPQFLAQAIVRALDIHDGQAAAPLMVLQDALGDRQMLLVLDNFEHLLAAAPDVATLLAAAPGLRLLVTSRARLRVSAETTYTLGPLGLPGRGQLTAQQLLQTAAGALFVARAAAVSPDFVPNDANAPAIATLCCQLDGIPLALELAAARCSLLALHTLVTRMGQRLSLLTGGPCDLPTRQRSLRAALDWSHELLPEHAQTLLARVAVFSDGWTLEAAEAVCGCPTERTPAADEGSFLDALNALTDHALAQAELLADGERRYRLLETIREYAHERLVACGELGAMRARHAAYYLQLVEHGDATFRGSEEIAWFDRLERELHNVRAALSWGLEHDRGLALRLSVGAWYFWYTRGYLGEGRQWLAQALAARPADTPPAAQARAHKAIGTLAYLQGDYHHAQAHLHEAIALYQRVGDQRGVATALNDLGNIAADRGCYREAEDWYAQSLEITRQIGDSWEIANTLNNLGTTLTERGAYPAARALIEESLERYTQLADKSGIAMSLSNLGELLHLLGEGAAAQVVLRRSLGLLRELHDLRGMANALSRLGYVELAAGAPACAADCFCESLTLRRQLDEKRGVALSLESFAALAVYLGRCADAATLLAVAAALRQTVGIPATPVEQANLLRLQGQLSRACDGPTLLAAQTESRLLSLSQAIELALALTDAR